MDITKIVRPEYLFYIYIKELFDKLGFEVEFEATYSKRRPDFIVKNREQLYYIELKISDLSERTIERIINAVKDTEMIPVIVTLFEVKNKSKYLNENPQLKILDISNLLYIVKHDEKLKSDLISILSFSIDDILPEKPFFDINLLENLNYANTLIEKLRLCKSGKKYSNDYEKICFDLLRFLFSEDLALWKEQHNSNQKLYRFDLLCRIKDDNKRIFWSIIENYFKSKYIIFEFKNYSKKVTQKEIYTTEKYLYSKALRSVGILVTPNGYDTNAIWASRGCLRENGKLILLLTNNDLLEMVKIKNDNENPSEYLLNILDDILLELEK